jgi:Ca2+-binding EF-hand superfamily protein
VRIRNTITVVAATLAVQAAPALAQTFSKNTESMVDSSIRRLLRQMDRDKNGTVSKGEFLRHFSERFDRLDVNHNRRLEADELRPMLIPNVKVRKPQPKVF